MTTEDKGKLGKPLFRYFYNHLSNYTKTIIRLRLMILLNIYSLRLRRIIVNNQKANKWDSCKSTVENHCRKQVQMHALTRHLWPFYCSSPLERNAPTKFGECFKYNRCYYTMFDGEHAIVEEFVPGSLLSMWTTMEIVFQFQKMPPRIWRIYSWKHKLWFTIAMWSQTTNSSAWYSRFAFTLWPRDCNGRNYG